MQGVGPTLQFHSSGRVAAGVRFAISLKDPWIVANRERGMPLSAFWKLWKSWFTIELVHGQQASKRNRGTRERKCAPP